MVKLNQHSSSEYAPRTFYNVNSSDATVAFALSFGTPGERLTHTACITSRKPILQLSLYDGMYQNVQALYDFCVKHNVKVLNVAGNCIDRFVGAVNQDQLNKDIYGHISKVHKNHPFEKIISGGQTGVDFAAGVAASVLDIECIMTLPRGFKQRGEDGIDFTQDYMKLKNKLNTQVRHLKKHLNK